MRSAGNPAGKARVPAAPSGRRSTGSARVFSEACRPPTLLPFSPVCGY